MTSSGAPMRPELTMDQPSALRVSAICSLPTGSARTKMVKPDAPSGAAGGG
jgi:hypothetical protein